MVKKGAQYGQAFVEVLSFFAATMVWMVGMADNDGTQGQSSKKKKRKKQATADETGKSRHSFKLPYKSCDSNRKMFCSEQNWQETNIQLSRFPLKRLNFFPKVNASCIHSGQHFNSKGLLIEMWFSRLLSWNFKPLVLNADAHSALSWATETQSEKNGNYCECKVHNLKICPGLTNEGFLK